jgi:methionyl-tRNA formyltransferase
VRSAVNNLMNWNRIALLVGRAESSNIVYNALKRDFDIVKVIEEEPVARREFLQRRLKKLGVAKVAGQLMFRAGVVPLLARGSRDRVREICNESGLDPSGMPDSVLARVPSVNDLVAMRALAEAEPEIVVVNGTRIISAEVLKCVAAPFVNMHAGITPLYRGVHGAYWALVDNNRSQCGVTIHLVDKGIDTGGVLAQACIKPTARDNFLTYTYLQLAAGIPTLKIALKEILEGRDTLQPAPAGNSRLWTHPTIGEYFRHRLFSGVK